MESEYKTEDFYYRSAKYTDHLTRESPEFKEAIRKLRKEQTQAESILWQQLRRKQCAGFKFYRQFPIDGYVVDFFCKAAKLGIEIDGSIHALPQVRERDAYRQQRLEKIGITIIRFSNEQVVDSLHDVMKKIKASLDSNHNAPSREKHAP